ncbi:hypothetical protein BDW69DRAFT_189354 [Aspergillus filifer]
MSLLNASRPALQSTKSLTTSRPFSVSTPARLSVTAQNQSPRGYLAKKGAFPFHQRAPSFEEVIARSENSEAAELMNLRSENAEQARKIEVLQGTMYNTFYYISLLYKGCC